MANFQMWPRISENQKTDGKGQASVGLLLPAGGPRQGLARGPQAGVGWVGLLAGPPAGRKRSRGASTWAPGAAVGPRREEAQDLKKRRPLAFSLLVLGGLGQCRRAACLRVVHAGWQQDGDRARTWSRGCYSVGTAPRGDALTAAVMCCGLEARASMAILGGGYW